MSMERCVTCNTPVDTDFDSECYVKVAVIVKSVTTIRFRCYCASCQQKLPHAKSLWE